jgi:hypothetical protein
MLVSRWFLKACAPYGSLGRVRTWQRIPTAHGRTDVEDLEGLAFQPDLYERLALIIELQAQ